MRVSVVVMMVPVVLAPFRGERQLPAKVGSHKRLDRRVDCSCPDCNSVMREAGQRRMADTSCDDDLNAEPTQPSREQSRLVFRSGEDLRAKGELLFKVNVNQREFAAAAEVAVQTSIFKGNGDLHNSRFQVEVVSDQAAQKREPF